MGVGPHDTLRNTDMTDEFENGANGHIQAGRYYGHGLPYLPIEHYPGKIIDDDLVNGKLDAAVVWGPIGGYFARRIASPELVVLPLKSEPGVRLDFGVAMGVRQGEKAWRSLIQQALDQSRDDISQVLREYGIPMVDEKGESLR